MRAVASPRLASFALITAGGALAALVLGRPAVAALVVPFGLAVAVGLAGTRDPGLRVAATVPGERVLEGDTVVLDVRVGAQARVAWLELLPTLPHGLEAADPPLPLTIALDGGGADRRIAVSVVARAWGAYHVGDVIARARGPLGVVVREGVYAGEQDVRVLPSRERLRRLVGPSRAQAAAGSRVAPHRGEGIEFADLRPFAPGDRVRRVNWRATARRGAPVVSDRHPERNADVVLFLDTFAEARRLHEGTLVRAVRAADTLAAAHLKLRDRVGLVAFGGVSHWLLPSAGTAQLERIADALLRSEIVFSYVLRNVKVLPPRSLPPHALVIAITPLLDERTATALADLRHRGHDLVVVEVSPAPFLPAPRTETDVLGRRLWELQRGALRGRFAALGVPVVVWDGEAPLAAAVEEVMAWRRLARRALRA
jgi:uncharacterized protein (DUF58 family)